MSNTPDILVDDSKTESAVDVASVDPCKDFHWIVRLEQRDAECQFRYVDRNGNINARLSSSMRLSKEEAKQFAKSITDMHPKYKAKALLYATAKPKK